MKRVLAVLGIAMAGAALAVFLARITTLPKTINPLPGPTPTAAISRGPCKSPVEEQIASGLKLLGKSNARHSGVMDLLLPHDESQYAALNKMAIMAISLFSKKEGDLPYSEVQFVPEQKDKITVLPSIFPQNLVQKLDPHSPTARALGRYRQNIFVFVPVRILRSKGDIVVRFKDRLTALRLTGVPVRIEEEFLQKDANPLENPDKLPDPKLVVQLLVRQYCLGR